MRGGGGEAGGTSSIIAETELMRIEAFYGVQNRLLLSC